MNLAAKDEIIYTRREGGRQKYCNMCAAFLELLDNLDDYESCLTHCPLSPAVIIFLLIFILSKTVIFLFFKSVSYCTI